MMKRLNVYIDGFNLYFGMHNSGFNDCKWLDIHALVELIKQPHYNIASIKYFTARISNSQHKQKRQNVYLEALETTPIKIIYGQFRNEETYCKVCGQISYESKEKMTDVNIATNLLMDAQDDSFDVAFIISGDSDLVPPIKLLRERFPTKDIITVFPPNRESNELKKNSTTSFTLGRNKLNLSQFAKNITSKNGYTLTRPESWK